MTRLEHDSALSLEVRHCNPRLGSRGWGRGLGWYVVRTCPCHKDQPVSLSFGTKKEAARCLAVLDDDAKRPSGVDRAT